MREKFVIWALFDSGNGSYFNVAKEFDDIEIYSIGLDRENENDHFINLDLADYKRMFDDTTLFDTLTTLPNPDLIIASPPCESWSIASAMRGGNACWKQEVLENICGEMKGSRFTLRDYDDFKVARYKPINQVLVRLNGELCLFNTIEIIKHFKPKYYIVENPAFGRLWEYTEQILGFKWDHLNQTYYNNYDYPILKPTRFGSNVDLKLNGVRSKVKSESSIKSLNSYNDRSNIPPQLVREIFQRVLTLDGRE